MKKITQSPIYSILMIIFAALSSLIFPLIIAVAMLVIKIRADKKQISELNAANQELESPAYQEYKNATQTTEQLRDNIEANNALIATLKKEIEINQDKLEKLNKQINTQTNKFNKSRELYKSMEYARANFAEYNTFLTPSESAALDEFAPSVILKLHCMEYKDLRKAYRENDKQIDNVLHMYESRYTTKSNKAIYQLMVIALRSELQNILYNLKYEKLDKSIEDVKSVTEKYLKIAGSGNQSIAGTLKNFIGEIEYLFINAAKIEYNYYVKREQARQEQAALREQMKQEAEERKALEAEKQKIEKEEQKYQTEIEKLQEKLDSATETEVKQLEAKILELQSQLADVVIKKDEIIKLQNGKAGTVYVISNMGSFGEDVFKVGMTRRQDPNDRIKELGNASVPFQFDVHSFIFSDNAVELETKMHQILSKNRVNKVNPRKEFFKISLDELEEIVYSIEPTANFNRTMMAEEYRQSISSEFNYTSDYMAEIADDPEDD